MHCAISRTGQLLGVILSPRSTWKSHCKGAALLYTQLSETIMKVTLAGGVQDTNPVAALRASRCDSVDHENPAATGLHMGQ